MCLCVCTFAPYIMCAYFLHMTLEGGVGRGQILDPVPSHSSGPLLALRPLGLECWGGRGLARLRGWGAFRSLAPSLFLSCRGSVGFSHPPLIPRLSASLRGWSWVPDCSLCLLAEGSHRGCPPHHLPSIPTQDPPLGFSRVRPLW